MKSPRVLAPIALGIAFTLACGASKKETPRPRGAAGKTNTAANGGDGGTGGASANGGSAHAGARSGSGGGSSGGSGKSAGGTAGMNGVQGGSGGELGGATSEGGDSSGGLPQSGGAMPGAGGANGGRAAGGASGTGMAGQANAGAAGQASAPTLQGCATWALNTARGATSTITATSGGVLLFRPGDATNNEHVTYTTEDVTISQPGLSGDFDITVHFDHFQPGDAHPIQGPAFEAGVYHHAATGDIYSAIGRVGAGDAYMSLRVPNDSTPITSFVPVPDAAAIVGASGSIELARQAGIITVSITINGVKNSNSSMTPYEDDFVFYVGIGLVGQSQGPSDSSVRITSVEVDGGGGAVMSDSFDCTH